MENLKNILFALMWFAILGGALGAALAIASKAFEVKVDPKARRYANSSPARTAADADTPDATRSLKQ